MPQGEGSEVGCSSTPAMRVKRGAGFSSRQTRAESGGSVIFRKYSPAGEQSVMAGNLCEALTRTCSRPAVMCDRDSVIAAAGGARRGAPRFRS